jgi:hypothetical protein
MKKCIKFMLRLLAGSAHDSLEINGRSGGILVEYNLFLIVYYLGIFVGSKMFFCAPTRCIAIFVAAKCKSTDRI